MRRNWTTLSLALAAALACSLPAAAKSAHRHGAHSRHGVHYSYAQPGLAYAYEPHHRAARGHSMGYADLVGDPGTGFGFYSLPVGYRVAALRYRLTHRPSPWDNPIRSAAAADAARYYYNPIPAGRDYAYGVFNPNDGVGTPFFAGYYGPASEDEDRPFPFGAPYAN